jgi:hypothetical protein
VQFVSPSSSINDDHLDATHGESPVRFRTLDNIIGVATPPGLATRHLDGGELLAISADEPASLDEALKQKLLEESNGRGASCH